MSSMEEQLHIMQQQIAILQEQLNSGTPTPMQSADDTATLPLHAMGTRPHYDWSPSEAVTELMGLDAPLNTNPLLSDSERKSIIDSYPPMAHLDYKPPATIPSAERLMNKGQRYEDSALKHLQYVHSATYRPLDIFIHELITTEQNNPHLERYCSMLHDIRRLMLHTGSAVTQMRNNIALRAVDPSFSLKSNDASYTLPLDEFQNTVLQQTAAKKATREATANRRRRFPSGRFGTSSSFSNTPDPQFFRSVQQQQQQQQLQQQQQQHQQRQPQFQQQQQQQLSTEQQEDDQSISPVDATTSSLTSTDPMGNRLSNFHTNWTTTISINSFVNTTIKHGYHIPFHTPPPVTSTPTPIIPFSKEQTRLIDQAIQDLLQKGAIEKVSPQQAQLVPGFYSSMFVIPKKNGGVRPVFNLKKLNQYLDAPHFKMETIREVSLMVNPNDYLVSIDLSDTFLHVGLHSESRRFLRLQWKNQVYQYCTTAFGLASSPFVFTKICRPILEHFRSQSFKISAYLDDWILAANSKELAIQQAQQVVDLLQHLGWIVNFKKSVLVPTQQLEHLGFVLNTQNMTASLPLKKLRDIRRSIKQVLDKPHRQSPRVIHSLTMRLQAATFAIFPARLYTRHLLYYKNQMVKNDRDWDLPRPLDQASLEELNWWYLNLQRWNGRSLLPTTPTQTIFVDASDTGWCCSWKTHRVHGYWTAEEAAQSINWRELKAAHLALKTFQVPQNSTVLIRTDNTTSLSYINKQGGTRSLPLIDLATEVWNWCLTNNINIQAQHIRGIHNTIADIESRRTFFKNQWQLKPKDYQVVTKIRVLDAGSGCYPHGCVYHSMKHLDKSLRKSTLESHITDSTEDNPGTTPENNLGGTLLAQCNLVSSITAPSVMSSSLIEVSGNPNDIPEHVASLTTSELDSLHVELIRAKLVDANLHEQATQDILHHKLAPTATNKAYRKNQLRFLDWAYKNQVSYTDFSGADMVNFLASIRQTHHLQVTTLKTVRAAVTHLHSDPTSISSSILVNNYLDSLSRQAPPISIHREPIDMSPSLAYASTIPSRLTTSVKLLQQKLAFLLSMAAFLRPSDLARIPFSSCNVRPTDGCLTFQVVSPKETRKKRRIIKPFTIHPHSNNIELCPVYCFTIIRDHPSLASRPADSYLFVKSHSISQSLSASTLSSWLHREFISLSTNESRVSIRSIASSRALDQGVSMANIVSLGNWASSSTFQDHYQRNQMAEVDFTSTILSGSLDDEFFDASDTLD